MILAGDLGGTKTVLAVLDRALTPVHERAFPCAAYPSLTAIVDAFLAELPAEPRAAIAAACLGVAGPVTGATARITNLPWTIDAAALSAQLGGAPCTLINDLQATALGALALPASAFAVVQAGAPPAGQPTIAVIAPGTGLGEALLVADGGRYRALPSEAGHADFAATTDEEYALLAFLRGRHGDHVSYERVLSGAGIGELYDFARARSGADEPAWLTAELAAGDRAAAITRAALADRDPACARALALFVDVLGGEAGNAALRGLATGGVVIGGGIPPKILPALTGPRLIARLTAKGRFSAWMRALPVRVTLEPRAALLGAAHHALTHQDVHP